ncbi:arsenic transporter [Solirubrobacter sp. CPCC 204708]|uniref:SLC13 family permease n=1 Tax=Solirubrobacter deserti TaxID=2282478 RepID=A0ABT4RFT8_9ACTN|nr:SLC13 family permease [Solirubrobacter deserti]MBE2318133.1 arsenic transporter [Solirubrobacter deserti]MDA0137411.1 SLC13 family permease [Solirubrobacter deserti]
MIAAAAALVAAIAAAIGRRAPEALVALVGAALLLVFGVLEPDAALDEAESLASTLIVLASLLVLGDGCERAGLFDALAARMAARARGSGPRLLGYVFGAAVAVTAVLGLDATVVLLTPAAFAAAAKARLAGRPHVYACSHLANSASTLLPVSNLTNLLAFSATGLSFAGFAAHMALPTAVAIAIEWIVIRRVFRTALAAPGTTPDAAPPPLPRRPLVILALTLAGFVVAEPLHLDPAWPAALGALAMVPRIRAIDFPLLAFVLGLSLIVRALADAGLADIAADVLPSGTGLLALLGATFLAAALANTLNNVPALLVLLPAAAAAGPHIVLAVLIGVNAGPNLTYTGSLATLLWRRVLHQQGEQVSHREFHLLGVLSVPPILVLGTVALWLTV